MQEDFIIAFFHVYSPQYFDIHHKSDKSVLKKLPSNCDELKLFFFSLPPFCHARNMNNDEMKTFI